MTSRLRPAALAPLALAACASPAPQDLPQPPRPQAAIDEDCGMAPVSQGLDLIYGPRAIYPGEGTGIYPQQYAGPAILRLDPACMAEVVVEPADGVTLIPLESGGYRLQTADDIAPGTTITITATVAGAYPITNRVTIYDTASYPLAGIWAQSQEECGSSAIRELQFFQGGFFTVTWQPFETYNDYWGDYVYDAEAGSLVLAIEDGNDVPFANPNQALRISLDGDVLTLEAGSFGSNEVFGECRAPFARRRNG